MVGLKTFWIAISALFLLGACVPSTKQSSCGENEAFNASLRTCVPIVGGAESFVTVKDFVPSSVISKSRSDYVDTTLSITVANPYNQAYSIQWERIYNGTTYPMPATGLSAIINPGQLGTAYNQIGTHIVTAKVIVNSKQVDSHNFTIQINQNPKPSIQATPIVPDPGAGVTFNPGQGIQTFSFTIKNNIGLDPLHNWQTRWTVVKNNSTYATEVDAFASFSAADSNYPSLDFDPSVAGIGSYTVRAIVANNPPAPYVAEVVDERLWIVTVKHPDFGTVTNAHTPLVSTQTVAFHGISYDTWGFRTGVDASTTKGQYCVRVSKPEGAYIDGSAQDPLNQGIVVKFYKDGGSSPIFQGYTTSSPLKDTVCFSEASAAEQANLFFNDGSSTVPYYKTLKARVFDDQTQLELCVDGSTCPVTYPISWNILVRPTNTPPVARILPTTGAGDLIAYSSTPTSSTVTANATVTQDQNFTVRFSIADLAGEYDTSDPLSTDKFKYTAILKRGTTSLSHSCVKDFSDAIVGSAYSCQFTLPSSDLAGPIAPEGHTLTIQAEDLNSPVPGSTGQLANLLTWNLTVTESNTPPTASLTNILVGAVVTPTPSEGQTITFQLAVNDAEKDNYNVTVYKCSEATCTATLTSFVGNSATVAYGNAHYTNNRTISYYIPEDEIGNVASGTIYFKAVVVDIPNTALLAQSTELVIPVNVNETNHPPVINVANLTSPAVNNVTPYSVMSGYRFSISTAGGVTDASNPTTNEATLSYKWWIRPVGAASWTAIDGATSSDGTLKWTPGPEINTAVNHEITFCVTDGSYLRPSADPSVAGSVCSSQYYLINGKSNLAAITSSTAPNGEVAIHHVPSENLSYVAWASASEISVAKVTYNANGTMNGSGMRVVRFQPIDNTGTTATVVKNLSIAASNTAVYVAYLADDSSTPGFFKARVRKINISNTETKTNSAFAASSRKFDFSYDPYTVSVTCAGANCSWNAGARTVTFNGVALLGTDNISITTNSIGSPGSVSIPVTAGSTITPDTICGGCNANDQARTFAEAVNNHASTALQGITASYSGSVVTITGMETLTHAWNSPSVISAIGKIVVIGGSWYLPVVNPSLAGADQNKIQIFNAAEGTPTTVNTPIALTLEAASFIDNAVTANNRLLLGYTTLSGSTGKVIELDASFLAATSPITVFSGVPLTSIKVRPSPGTTNPNHFVVAKSTLGAHYLARLPSTLSSSGSQFLASNIADTTFAHNSTILTNTVVDMDVQPALPQGASTTNEARVLVVADSGTGNFNSYIFRWKQTLATPFNALDVAEGQVLEKNGEYTSTTSKIISSSIASITFGSGGSTPSDNTNAAIPFVKVNMANRIEFGLLNSEIETIHSDNRDSTGLFRPALVR